MPYAMQQIHIEVGSEGYEFVNEGSQRQAIYGQEHEKLKQRLTRFCPAHIWPQKSLANACPRPILLHGYHQNLLSQLHDALTAALIDIVRRWWTDQSAEFPRRMPLEPGEEELLKWLELQVSLGNLADCSQCQGSWRPDFMVEQIEIGQGEDLLENFRITEINARFPFNGFMHEAYGQMALDSMDLEHCGLMSATDGQEIINGLISLFEPGVPLHILQGDGPSIDLHMFINAVHRQFGFMPRLIRPSQLRIVRDPQGGGESRLCCTIGEKQNATSPFQTSILTTAEGELVEEIHQVGLEVCQREVFALDAETLRHLGLLCFNDMRTILLVHDKRLLGIVKQEIPSLIAREILNAAQAKILEQGLADTILPASQQLDGLVQDCEKSPELRNDFILKPIRSGKGRGILFGEDLIQDEWISALKSQMSLDLELEKSCVVQRRIRPRLYDLILKSSGEMVQYPLVGTYHVVDGKLLGLGTWRSNGDRICAVSSGGAWMCSVMPKKQQRLELIG